MRTFIFTLLLCAFSLTAVSQPVYFVDGYHGGIYGHYPVEGYTDFIVDQFEANPEWRISIEIEPETWDTVMVRTPEAYKRFKNIVCDPRMEFTNPTYAQPYCYNVSGESIIRQFEYGIRSLRRHFPDLEFVTYSVEEPCFTSSLPQILSQFGFRYAVLKCPNTCWGGYTAPYGGELVSWIGPDGTSILTVPRYACEELEENSTWQTTAWGNSRKYLDACFAAGIEHPVGMTFQDAGWKYGPWLDTGDRKRNGSIYVTWREYIEDISVGATSDDYRMPQEDILPELMWGSQVLQRIARQVRAAENKVVQAEKMSLIANLGNGYRHAGGDIDEAWRTLMLAQHHDSWIVPYNRLHQERTWAEEIGLWTENTNIISEKVITGAAGSFGGGSAPGYVRVFNTQGSSRSEIASIRVGKALNERHIALEDSDGKRIPTHLEGEGLNTTLKFLAEVPPFGYSTYRIVSGDTGQNGFSEVRLTGQNEYVVENEMYRIVFDVSRGGTLTSLVSKKEGFKDFAPKEGEFRLGEIRGHFYDEGSFRSSAEKPAEITLLTNNGFETVILIEGEIASHPFRQTVTLAKGQPRIGFELTVDWQGNPGIGEYKQVEGWSPNRRAYSDGRYKLNVLFPADLDSPALYKDAPFDVCESKLDNTFFQTWEGIKHNVILNWVDISEHGGHGLAILSDHTTSYVHGEDFPLGLTAQYSGVGLWNRNYGIDGPLTINYAVIPHSGKWDGAGIAAQSSSWREPLVTALYDSADMENTSLIDVGASGYEISAAYPAENGIIIRLFNAEGDGSRNKIRFGFPVGSVSEIDLNGNIVARKKITSARGKKQIKVEMPRFGLRTFLITLPA